MGQKLQGRICNHRLCNYWQFISDADNVQESAYEEILHHIFLTEFPVEYRQQSDKPFKLAVELGQRVNWGRTCAELDVGIPHRMHSMIKMDL